MNLSHCRHHHQLHHHGTLLILWGGKGEGMFDSLCLREIYKFKYIIYTFSNSIQQNNFLIWISAQVVCTLITKHFVEQIHHQPTYQQTIELSQKLISVNNQLLCVVAYVYPFDFDFFFWLDLLCYLYVSPFSQILKLISLVPFMESYLCFWFLGIMQKQKKKLISLEWKQFSLCYDSINFQLQGRLFETHTHADRSIKKCTQ